MGFISMGSEHKYLWVGLEGSTVANVFIHRPYPYYSL